MSKDIWFEVDKNRFTTFWWNQIEVFRWFFFVSDELMNFWKRELSRDIKKFFKNISCFEFNVVCLKSNLGYLEIRLESLRQLRILLFGFESSKYADFEKKT